MRKIKTALKIFISLFVVCAALGANVYYVLNSDNNPFEDVCKEGNSKYTDLCDNVGRHAHTNKRMAAFKDTDYGEIVGVSWRERGGIISSPNQKLRYSDSFAYYYIVNSGQKGRYFLLNAKEVDAR